MRWPIILLRHYASFVGHPPAPLETIDFCFHHFSITMTISYRPTSNIRKTNHPSQNSLAPIRQQRSNFPSERHQRQSQSVWFSMAQLNQNDQSVTDTQLTNINDGIVSPTLSATKLTIPFQVLRLWSG